MIESAAQRLQPMPQPATSAYPQPRVVGKTSNEACTAHDAVELSDAAQRESGDMSARPVRNELVKRVREEIADGTSVTDEKLDAVVNRLHRALFTD